jgi:hypothetical protein
MRSTYFSTEAVGRVLSDLPLFLQATFDRRNIQYHSSSRELSHAEPSEMAREGAQRTTRSGVFDSSVLLVQTIEDKTWAGADYSPVRRHRVLAKICVAAGIALLLMGCHEELGHKDDYAYLQTVEYDNRSVSPEKHILFNRDSHSEKCSIGVRDLDGKRIWLLLNHEDDVLTVPKGEVLLSSAELSKVLSFCSPSEAVARYLSRSVDAV